MTDPLALLGRGDKVLLAGGDGIAFSPLRDPSVPGFWEGATVLGRDVSPLFAVTILDADGRELIPALATRRWTPAALVSEYRFVQGVQGTEIRTVHPGGVFVSEWRVSAFQPTTLHLVAWTAVDAAAMEEQTLKYDGAIVFARAVDDGAVECALAVVGGATSWAACSSEGALDSAEWKLTPFLEQWRHDGLPRTVRTNETLRGRCYAAVHRVVRATRDGAPATFAMRAIPREPALRPPTAARSAAPSAGTFESASVREWTSRFAAAPQLRASDPYVERAYWYRWFGAWALRVAPGTGAFTSGGASAHARAIGIADATLVPALVRDLRWHPDPEWVRSVLAPFFDHQRTNGAFPREVSITGPSKRTAPPVVDWGGALHAYAACEVDRDRVRRAWLACAKYAKWLFGRAASGDALISLHAPADTDAAASPRFAGVDGAIGARTVRAVDASANAVTLARTLAALADAVGENAASWTEHAERCADAIRSRMWDDDLGFYCDLDGETNARIRVRSAAAFSVLGAGVAPPEAHARMVESLVDVRRFWTAFPVPSLAADEPAFDPLGEWEGVRAELPRNGRMWPAETAVVIDALASAPGRDEAHRRVAAQLLSRLVRAHFPDGDLHAPGAHEHVNPITGHASVYRGIDECFAAWLVDLIVRHGAGIHVDQQALRVDPLPLGLESLAVHQLRVRGRRVDVSLSGDRVVATVDGVDHQTVIGQPIVVGS